MKQSTNISDTLIFVQFDLVDALKLYDFEGFTHPCFLLPLLKMSHKILFSSLTVFTSYDSVIKLKICTHGAHFILERVAVDLVVRSMFVE